MRLGCLARARREGVRRCARTESERESRAGHAAGLPSARAARGRAALCAHRELRAVRRAALCAHRELRAVRRTDRRERSRRARFAIPDRGAAFRARRDLRSESGSFFDGHCARQAWPRRKHELKPRK